MKNFNIAHRDLHARTWLDKCWTWKVCIATMKTKRN